MIVSIHQPNYLPWLGFFDKIAKSDTFVIFDDVQFPRGKNHFGHRNLIKTNGGSKWLTIPLLGKSDFKNFNEIEINYINEWNTEHLRLIDIFYKKTPFFQDYFPEIKNILTNKYSTLSELNITLIKYFLNCLDIKTNIVLSSELCSLNIKGEEKILYILDQLKATKYISGTGPGSIRYINEDEFKNKNIELIWQHYTHPNYKQQFGDFIPYMSIIDLLFNEGVSSKDILYEKILEKVF